MTKIIVKIRANYLTYIQLYIHLRKLSLSMSLNMTGIFVKRKLLLSFLGLFFCATTYSQQVDKTVQTIERNEIDNTPTLITFTTTANWKDDMAQEIFKKYLGVDGIDITMKLNYSTTTKSKVTAKRYNLFYKDMKVEYGSYTLTCKNGLVTFITGNFYNIDKTAPTTPAITASDAFDNALKFAGAEKYMWEDPLEEQRIKKMYNNPDTSLKPKGYLTWIEDFSKGAGDRKLHLAYAFNIYARSPLSRQMVYIDAITGKVLHSNSLIKHTAATGHSRYSGIVPFQTSNLGATYELYDSTRGSGVHTLNMNNGSSYGASTEYISVSNTWPMAIPDTIALDAHWGAEMVYDYWKTVQGRLSYDDADGILLQYVHYQSGYNNAFWDGTEMTYGDGTGCGSGFTSLTSLDVTGHEIGHGVCQYTANLVYASESGAMNEAFSDCWGATIENWADPHEVDAVPKKTWWIGEEIKCGNPLREMDFPKVKGQPDTYGGVNWFNVVACVPSGGNDECGVHNNSGVMNKWYYLVSQGGSGTNDVPNVYSVTGIGISEAANILYQTELVLSSTATYALMRTTSINTASTLYGPCSQEVITVTNAWYAVGVGAAYITVPVAITGATNVCVGGTTILSDATPSGTWSSSFSAIATIGGGTGVVTGVTPGIDTITYTTGAGCNAKALVTVNALPSATISPAPTTALCTGSTVLLTAGSGAGYTYQWRLAGTPIGGATNITYTTGVTGNYTVMVFNTAGCIATSAITNVIPVALPLATISALSPTTFCAGSSVILSANYALGYSYQWQSGGIDIPGATSQFYTAGSAGNYTVIVTNSLGCIATSAPTAVVVNPLPAAISGTPSVCFAASTLLSDATPAGLWSSSNTSVATVSVGGNVTGVAAGGGLATISYTLTGTGCYATVVVTVNTATPTPITGPSVVCTGQTITLADGIPGGSWSSSNIARATVNSSGVVSGISAGTAIITYTITNACGTGYTLFPVSINNPFTLAPSVSVTAHPNPSCAGDLVVFTAVPTNGGSSPSYTWTKNGVPVASGPTFTYAPNNGDVIVCKMTSNYPCITTNTAVSAPLVQTVQSHLPNTVSIFVSKSSISAGSVDTFVAVAPNGGPTPAYQWLINGAVIPGATSSMYITTTLANGQLISCRVTTSLPCAGPATVISSGIMVNVIVTGVQQIAKGKENFTIIPNPNKGEFTIEGMIGAGSDEPISIIITDMLGQTIYTQSYTARNGEVYDHIILNREIANGMYLVSVTSGTTHTVFHMVLNK